MIRSAEVSDIPKLLEMGERFSRKADLESHVGYNPDDMATTFEALIANRHPVFIGEAGAIGATCTPHPFNASHIAAQELFWWSEGREGLRLLDRLEAHCEEHCHSLTMITLEAIKPQQTGRLYMRRGFEPVERSYMKVY